MNQTLKQESEKLARSWMRHDQEMLREYLIASVEDPRLNVQSLLSRHFLIVALFADKFQQLMDHELRFAAAMNWLVKLLKPSGDPEELQAVLHGLRQGADNAEGIEIPQFLAQTFAALPTTVNGMEIPNYLESILARQSSVADPPRLKAEDLDRFMNLWRHALADETPERISALEPACGSANDYRFLHACGLARLIDYTGFDLCQKNMDNARAMFPEARFELGNVFAIKAADRAFEYCFLHDLFEHLSLEGLETAVAEICRVTRDGICAGFFNMDEIPDHVVRPVEEYHWNTLSLDKTTALFAQHGFAAQVFNIEAYLAARTGCRETHNPNAYTLLLFRQEGVAQP